LQHIIKQTKKLAVHMLQRKILKYSWGMPERCRT